MRDRELFDFYIILIKKIIMPKIKNKINKINVMSTWAYRNTALLRGDVIAEVSFDEGKS